MCLFLPSVFLCVLCGCYSRWRFSFCLLFEDHNQKLGMNILFISHELASVYALCHRLALIDGGEIVECNTPQVIFNGPVHPFTKRLIAALPSIPKERTYALATSALAETASAR